MKELKNKINEKAKQIIESEMPDKVYGTEHNGDGLNSYEKHPDWNWFAQLLQEYLHEEIGYGDEWEVATFEMAEDIIADLKESEWYENLRDEIAEGNHYRKQTRTRRGAMDYYGVRY